MPLTHCDSPYPHWRFENLNPGPQQGDVLRVVPERGGLVTGWRCGDREVIYLDVERFLDPTKSVRGGIPVLFPICGPLPGSSLPQHGFARDQSWQLSELADGAGIQLALADNETTRAQYPHAFSLVLQLRLEPKALAINALITNRSQAGAIDGTTQDADNQGPDNANGEMMPFSFGLHPYFNVSDLAAVSFEGLPERCLNHLTMADEATDTQMQRLSDGIDLLVRPSGDVRMIDAGAGAGPASLTLRCTHPLDLAVLWTDPPRNMVCLEPWSGPRLSLASGDRRLELAPGASMELHTRYELA